MKKILIFLFIFLGKVYSQEFPIIPDLPEVTNWDIKVLLQEYMLPNDTLMNNTLQSRGLLPEHYLERECYGSDNSQQKKWKHYEKDVIIPISNLDSLNITDYIMVEFRKDNIFSNNPIQVPALLLTDGTVRNISGIPGLIVPIINGRWICVIHHKSSLSVGSTNPILVEPAKKMKYDFTSSLSSAYWEPKYYFSPPMVQLGNGKWCLWGGDCSGGDPSTYLGYCDNLCDISDQVMIQNLMTLHDTLGYKMADVNGDGIVNIEDYNISLMNWKKISSVPFNGISQVSITDDAVTNYKLMASSFHFNNNEMNYSLFMMSNDSLNVTNIQAIFNWDINSSHLNNSVIYSNTFKNIFINNNDSVINSIMSNPNRIIDSLYRNIADYYVGYTPVISGSPPFPLSWKNDSAGLNTKVFANINGIITNITNPNNHFIDIGTGTNTNPEILVKDYNLYQNYPNPFNPSTKINFGIPKSGLVSIKVYDINGKLIGVLLNEYKNAGSYSVSFNGSNLSSGIYFYTLSSTDFIQTKKMILIK